MSPYPISLSWHRNSIAKADNTPMEKDRYRIVQTEPIGVDASEYQNTYGSPYQVQKCWRLFWLFPLWFDVEGIRFHRIESAVSYIVSLKENDADKQAKKDFRKRVVTPEPTWSAGSSLPQPPKPPRDNVH